MNAGKLAKMGRKAWQRAIQNASRSLFQGVEREVGIYSLGATLYHLLIGCPALVGPVLTKVLLNVIAKANGSDLAICAVFPAESMQVERFKISDVPTSAQAAGDAREGIRPWFLDY
ncbi:MAG TPA: hypothetical protein DDZ51_19805 [Planctomycetaceae bacterium]|nr:hypothetical protein [Planctomycetaceae bacterium]